MNRTGKFMVLADRMEKETKNTPNIHQNKKAGQYKLTHSDKKNDNKKEMNTFGRRNNTLNINKVTITKDVILLQK